uniref:cytochrome oxidase subunit 1 n=1 Tax=Perkinsus marinus TaxID=31276 RepID=UPI00226D31F2
NKFYILVNNNKRIGIYYIKLSIIIGILGIVLSYIIRVELYNSGNRIIKYDNVNYYNMVITLHGLLMIFYIIMPGLYGGIPNYILPILSVITDIVLPRINNISIIIVLISYIVVINSIVIEYNIGTGWTLYPPLSIIGTVIVNMILYGLIIIGISSIISAINFMNILIVIDGIIYVYIWSIIITSVLLIISLPILNGILLMILSDIYFNSIYFILNGDVVLYQHLFWYFGHPEVYILILPAFGIISIILSVLNNKIIFGMKSMILAIIMISILGSIVWAHHIYTVGLELDTKIYFNNLTLIISIPTGNKIYNWIILYIGSYNILYNGYQSLIFSIMFIIIFIIGGITGIIISIDIIDIGLHDTYYIVSHFHYILSIGAVISLLAGILLLKDIIGYYNVIIKINKYFGLLLFININIIFTPQFIIGFNVMPRRILEYSDNIIVWNLISSIGSISTILILLSIF